MSPSGEVITFYSFKGGTGRTMAMANVATILSQEKPQPSILMVDWDIEAPGLHRFFERRFEQSTLERIRQGAQPGLLDLFLAIEEILRSSGRAIPAPGSDDEADAFFTRLQIDRFIVRLQNPSLDFILAGSFNEDYASRVQGFDWAALYHNHPWIYTSFAGFLSRRYRYVFVDSRTGVSDTTGICTALMPDKLVAVFTPNTQSIVGAVDPLRRALNYRKASGDLRPLLIFPLPSRVETAEPSLRETWRRGEGSNGIPGYQPLFEELLADEYDLPACDLEAYFDQVQIQYIPRYSYGEELAVLDERASDRLSLARSYQTFTIRLIAGTGPWAEAESATTPAPALDEPPNEAVQLYMAALDKYDIAGNVEGQASVLRRLGDTYYGLGELDKAEQSYKRSRELFQIRGDKHGEATVLKGLGDSARRQGDVVEAARYYDLALTLFQDQNSPKDAAAVFRAIGELQESSGALRSAEQSFTKAVTLSGAANDVRGRATGLLMRADVLLLLNDHNGAVSNYDQAVMAFQQLSDVRSQLTACKGAFTACMRAGRVNDANARFRRATGNETGAIVEKEWKGEALTQMGDQLRSENRYEEALAMYKEARDVYGDGPNDALASVLRSLGDMEVETRVLTAAKVSYEKALEIYRANRDDLGEASLLERLGTLAAYRE